MHFDRHTQTNYQELHMQAIRVIDPQVIPD